MQSPVIQIRPAQREGARIIVGIAGQSGSGKTLTALYMAYGLANYDASKVGFLDTENRRGSLYSDALRNHPTHPTDTPFLIGDLFAPFSPQRYKDAILAFQAAGVEVLVVDSVTHEYEGQGGYLEIREPLPGKSGKRDNVAAAEHKKFMGALLQSDMHVVACVRAREKTAIEKDAQGKSVYVPLGLLPIQHRDFMYEMTASVMMHDRGRRHDLLKNPHDDLLHLFPGEGFLGADTGKALRDWVDGAKQLDPKVEQYRNRLISITEKGKAYVEESWGKVPAAIQAALGDAFKSTLIAAATEYEQQHREKIDDGGAADLNKAIAGAGDAPTAANDNTPAASNDNAPPEQASASDTEQIEQIF